MKIPGQSNYKGINAQSWAAMSLFLQYLRNGNFLYIELETPGFQDFNLVFKDGKKIICESKARSKPLSYSNLKEILSNILLKKTIDDKDEILIICTKLDEKLSKDVENIKYWSKFIAPKFKKKKFTEEEIIVLEKVRFWVVDQTANQLTVYSLFSELLDFWLPEDELEAKCDSILIRKIYEGSSKGAKFTREEVLKNVADIRQKAKEYSGYFDNARVKTEIQFKNVIDALENNLSPVWASGQLAAISAKPSLASFILDRLSQKKIRNLQDWGEIWQLYKVYRFSFSLSRIFEQNLNSEKNIKFVLNFLDTKTKILRRFYQADFLEVDVTKIVKKIIASKQGKRYLEDAFLVLKNLITFNEKAFFYLKDNGHDRKEWEKGEVCKVLHEIYSLAGDKLKQKIFDLIITSFNITEDDGEFTFYAPSEIYSILGDWLQEGFIKKDFFTRFEKLVKIIVDQYDKFYRKFDRRVAFKGWEHMGGGISYSGGYHAYDRHFIYILSPALRKFYDSNPNKNWQLIKQRCINPERKVSKQRPDFLNRAVYPIVLDRYASTNSEVSEEAFEILKEFILSKRGIPHKRDLIYQAVINQASLSIEKKWRLVELTIKKFNVPVNAFVEQIVTQLAKSTKGYEPAKQEMKKWFCSSDYYTKRFFLSLHDSIDSITQLLDSDFDFATELFKCFLFNSYFGADKSDKLGGFTAAQLLNKIFSKPEGYPRALAIINELGSKPKLSLSQQVVLCYSIFNSQGNDDSDDSDLLMKIYNDFVDPFLNKFDNDVNKLKIKITNAGARSALVQFAGRLATKKKIAEALRIIKVFIKDPDPYLPGQDPDDRKNKYNEHYRIVKKGEETHSITSVRGWCGWELMKCAVLDGRSYLRQTIDLTKILCEDDNYYVLHMACFALSQLAKNRLTVLPDKRDTLFFSDDVVDALKLSKEVEGLAFGMLDKVKNAPKNVRDNVQKSLVRSILQPFDSIRALSHARALYLVRTLAGFPEETLDESAPLFIYYAEYRKDDYKNWKWARPGLYDDLQPWDSKPFEDLIKQIFAKVKDRKNLFKFAAVSEKPVRDGSNGVIKEKEIAISLKYFKMLNDKYEHRVFGILYMAINEAIGSKFGTKEWYDLYIQCLTTESKFYEETLKNPTNIKDETYRGMYWWPEMDNFAILEKIYKIFGLEHFLKAVSLIASFPKEFDIHETEPVIELLKQNKTDSRAKKNA